MFGDRVLDRDEHDESCLDIARRVGQKTVVEFLTQSYPQLKGKVRMGDRSTRRERDIDNALTTIWNTLLYLTCRLVLTRTLNRQLQVMALQRGI